MTKQQEETVSTNSGAFSIDVGERLRHAQAPTMRLPPAPITKPLAEDGSPAEPPRQTTKREQ